MKLPTFMQQLPAEISERLGEKRVGRQRAMVADGHLLLILHKAPLMGSHERDGVFFWRLPDGSWICDQYSGIERLTEHLEEYEVLEQELFSAAKRAKNADDYYRLLGRLGPLQHSTHNLYSALQAARAVAPSDRDLIDFNDWAYDLDRAFELLYLDTRHALDYQTAKKAEEEARMSTRSVQMANRLNILAANFFPISAVVGIFGMNVKSGWEESVPGLFWVILLGGAFSGLLMSWWAINGVKVNRSNKQHSEI